MNPRCARFLNMPLAADRAAAVAILLFLNGQSASRSENGLRPVRSCELTDFIEKHFLQDADDTLRRFTVPFVRVSQRLLTYAKRLVEGR